MTVQDVTNAGSPNAHFLRNLAMGQSNTAKPEDLAEYLRRHSNAIPTPKVLTVGDWLKMVGADARWDAA